MAATISSSVRLSPELEGALRSLGANRATILLGFLLVGVAELGAASGLDTSTMQTDLHQVLRYHLPEPLRGRLEAVQNALSVRELGGNAGPEQLEEPAELTVRRDRLVDESDGT